MKKIFIFIILQFLMTAQSAGAITPLELKLREIRDDYRFYPEKAVPAIKNLWNSFPSPADRTRIFLDLRYYYRRYSLNEPLLEQGKWLINNSMPEGNNASDNIKLKIWTMIPVAETLAREGKHNEAIQYYETAFTLGCGLLKKDHGWLTRDEFIRCGMEGISLWGGSSVSAAYNFANANKFEDAYTISNSSKKIFNNGNADSTKMSFTSIVIMGLYEKKYYEACEQLKKLNNGRTFLTIEPYTSKTAEEEICLNAKDYEFLSKIYLNTLVINPPCEIITYNNIICNARSTIYVLNKIAGLLENTEFNAAFEKTLKEKLIRSNLSHLNVLLAEYYFKNKDFKQASEYFRAAASKSKGLKYYWPRYYPDLNPGENYKSPHRVHLWTTCGEWARKRLDEISKM